MSVFKDLIGKRINGVFVGNENWSLVFRTTDGSFFGYAPRNIAVNRFG